MNQKTKTGPDAAAPTAGEPQAEAIAPEAEEELHPSEALEVEVTRLLDAYSQPHLHGQYDQRLIAIARTQIELGFCAFYKALAKHEAQNGGAA
jgi:hypothetical protein